MIARLKWRRSVEKRSPLKDSPLRNPGQSVEEEIQRIMSNKVDEYAFWIAMCLGMAAFEWLRWYWQIYPHPVAISFVGLCGGGYCVVRLRSCKRQLRQLRQARDGEKAVGQYLDCLREKGYRVFHDVVGEGFNVDHVLIGPAGVFSIETKTISKPVKGQCKIAYDGESIAVNGFVPDRNPVVQAKAQAAWVKNLIKESTGRSVTVRPVVLYPGWYTADHPKGAEAWVLNPKNLPGFLEQEGVVLSPEDVALIAYHLSRYIRSSTAQKKA